MKPKKSIWNKMGLHDWFLKDDQPSAATQVTGITPNDIYKYIVEKFDESIAELSFAKRVVFYHEYIICLNHEDYNLFMETKKGIFGLIVQESVKQFYTTLNYHRAQGRTVEPSASKWVFRFVSHPDYARGDKGFIGKLLPGNTRQQQENLRLTFIPRQTGIAQTFDVNENVIKDFTFYSEGYYEVPYQEGLAFSDSKVEASEKKLLARFEATIPDKAFAGKKLEYLMRDADILVSGNEEQHEQSNIFRVPSEWVSSPHLRIRLDDKAGKLYMASFGERTILNENTIQKSDINKPVWFELPYNSRIVLNGIVGINVFKS
jgi:hypothetical protein